MCIRDRFTIDKDGDQIGDFTYEEKTFVKPFMRHGMMAPDIIEDEPAGSTPIEAGTEESRYTDNRGF